MLEEPFTFQPEEDGSLSLESAVFQALGAASVCWEPMASPDGVFQSQEAKKIGEALLAHIRAYKFDLDNVEPEFLLEALVKRGFVIPGGIQWEELTEKMVKEEDGAA